MSARERQRAIQRTWTGRIWVAFFVLVLWVVVSGCGGREPVRWEVNSRHHFSQARLDRLLAIARARWGSPDLSGWTIRVQDPRCELATPGWTAWGVTLPRERVICIALDGDPLTGACIEASALVHEVGHVAIPAAGHLDARWHDRISYAEAWADLMSPPQPGCEGFSPFYSGRW